MSWNFLMLKNHLPHADVEKGGESKEILMSATGTVFEGSNVYVSSIVCDPKMITKTSLFLLPNSDTSSINNILHFRWYDLIYFPVTDKITTCK